MEFILPHSVTGLKPHTPSKIGISYTPFILAKGGVVIADWCCIHLCISLLMVHCELVPFCALLEAGHFTLHPHFAPGVGLRDAGKPQVVWLLRGRSHRHTRQYSALGHFVG